jgi:hypothetical protein
MGKDIQVAGPPRPAAVPRFGYGYVVPLTDSPDEAWLQSFARSAPGTGFRHPPRIEEGDEIHISVGGLSDEQLTAALDVLADLVTQVTAEQASSEKETRAADEQVAQKTRERQQHLERVLGDWWRSR